MHVCVCPSASPDDHPGSAGRAAHTARPEPPAAAGGRQPLRVRSLHQHRADRRELPPAAGRTRPAGQGALLAEKDAGGDGAEDRDPEADAGCQRRVHQEAAGDAAEQRAAPGQGVRGGRARESQADRRGRGPAGTPGGHSGSEGEREHPSTRGTVYCELSYVDIYSICTVLISDLRSQL